MEQKTERHTEIVNNVEVSIETHPFRTMKIVEIGDIDEYAEIPGLNLSRAYIPFQCLSLDSIIENDEGDTFTGTSVKGKTETIFESNSPVTFEWLSNRAKIQLASGKTPKINMQKVEVTIPQYYLRVKNQETGKLEIQKDSLGNPVVLNTITFLRCEDESINGRIRRSMKNLQFVVPTAPPGEEQQTPTEKAFKAEASAEKNKKSGDK
jgi:hypothetical protein